MSDYVKRKDVIDFIRSYRHSTDVAFHMEEHLNEVPTADVVEVVRCKDCEYMCLFTDGHMECRLLADLRPVPCTYLTMKGDDFCSYGQKRWHT